MSASLGPDTEISKHVNAHGDGVKAIGLKVKDASAAFSTAVSRGAEAAYPYQEYTDESGVFRKASVHDLWFNNTYFCRKRRL